MKLISACLLGIRCAWDGRARENHKAVALLKSGILIPVCPEQLGGLATPRPPQEIQGGTGDDVIDGKCRVLNKEGEDVTQEFVRGAEETLKIANRLGINEFIAKSGSPSCGCARIYDGTFSGRLTNGDGVTTALLKRHGIKVTTELDL